MNRSFIGITARLFEEKQRLTISDKRFSLFTETMKMGICTLHLNLIFDRIEGKPNTSDGDASDQVSFLFSSSRTYNACKSHGTRN